MTKYFLPSCKVSAAYPEASRRLLAYVRNCTAIAPAGCCRNEGLRLSENDQAIVICHTCANIAEERLFGKSPARVRYIWEIIDEDESFPYPDYGGERITLQDCLFTYERHLVQKAVRSVLNKMNFRIEEAPKPGGEPFRCDLLMQPIGAANRCMAPRHYDERREAGGYKLFTPLPPEERAKRHRLHCALIPTERVVCYCRSCTESINQGGKQGLHLLELLFTPK